MEVSGQLHVPAALPLRKEPLIPTGRLGGPHSRSGRGVKREIPSPRRESEPRTTIVQPLAQCYTD
jgi:hypothetical protein